MKTLDRDAQQDRFMGFFVRPMRADNIAQVEELERECFPTTWPPTPFLKELQNRIARYLVACEVRRPGRPTPEEVLPPTPITTQPEPSAIGRFLSGVKGLFTGGKLPPQDSTQSIAGYVGIWLIADEAHITAIGSRNSLRGKGVGELLLIATVELARAHGSNVVTLEVRASNLVAHTLYEKYGFKRVGLRKGYYSDNGEDAIIMTTDHLSSPEYQARFEGLKRAHRLKWGESIRSLGNT